VAAKGPNPKNDLVGKNELDPVEGDRKILAAELAVEKRRFSDFLKTTEEWYWETDVEHRFVYISPSIYDVTGVPPEWYYGKTREEIVLKEAVNAASWGDLNETLASRQKFSNFVYQQRGPAGIKWMKISGIPVFENDGQFAGYRGSGADISDQVRAERTSTLLEAAVDNLGEVFALWDSEDRLVFCNERFRRINAAVPHATLPGTTFREHLSIILEAGLVPDAVGCEEAWFNDRLARHRSVEPAFELRRQDGTCFLVHEQSLPEGSCVALGTEITSLKEAEREVEEKVEVLETAFRTIPDGILLLESDQQPLAWNIGLLSLMNHRELGTDVTPEAARTMRQELTRNLTGIDGTDGRPFPELKSGGNVINEEKKFENGRWVEYRVNPLSEGGYVAVFRDFTERRKVDRMKDQFVSTISHELRTPLTSIIGSLKLIRGGAVGELTHQAGDLLEVASQNSERLLNLINNILDLEKMRSGDFNLEIGPIAVSELIEASVEANQGYAKRFGVTMTVVDDAPDSRISGDRQRLMQVMDNLISNAAKHSSEGNEVEVLINRRSNWIRVSVSDRGPGIPTKFRDQVFNRFTQADSSDTRTTAGTGLGLSISKSIIDLHRGNISFHTALRVGTMFYFELAELEEQTVS